MAQLIDTNGCGDSFVGGFLACAALHGHPLTGAAQAECVQVAMRCASVIACQTSVPAVLDGLAGVLVGARDTSPTGKGTL